MKSGIQLITEERNRQITTEGYTAEHDDKHDRGEIAFAAACYAITAAAWLSGFAILQTMAEEFVGKFWMWDKEHWKPKGARPDLIRAGALIVAELDRLERLEKKS